uniref:Unannotated protein n=1 Tax=freshwater metagenome TaxID=449393 RepID=A0A6J6A2L4_9ZZZZ
MATRLLGGEVGGRAEHRADLRDRGLFAKGLGDSEVCELDDAVARAQQVPRLDVAVDHAAAVGVVEPAACLREDSNRLGDREHPFLIQDLGAGASLDVLHHDVLAAAVGVLPKVVDLNNVGVNQPRSG